MSDDVDELDDAACRSLRGDIGAGSRRMVRSERRREPVRARHEAMPFPVGSAPVGLANAFLASHPRDDACDVSDVSEVPTGPTVEVLPTDFRRRHPNRPSPIPIPPGSDWDWTARGGGSSGGAACTSFRWHLPHFSATMCGIHHPKPCPSHPKRSYTSWRPCPPLEGCLARPRLKRGRAPNLGSVFLS